MLVGPWPVKKLMIKVIKKIKVLQENVRSGGRADDLFGVSEDFANQQLNQDEDKKMKPRVTFINMQYHGI